MTQARYYITEVSAENLPALRNLRATIEENSTYSVSTLTPAQADMVGDRAARLANFWEAHPEIWLKNSYQQGARACNMGIFDVAAKTRDLDNNGVDDMIRGFGFDIGDVEYTVLTRVDHVFISLNDDTKTNLSTDIAGLRFIADVCFHMAVGWTAKQATKELWKQYGFNKLTEKQVAKAEVNHAKEVKLAQVRKARALAKQRGYKTVKAMRADGWKREFDNAA